MRVEIINSILIENGRRQIIEEVSSYNEEYNEEVRMKMKQE